MQIYQYCGRFTLWHYPTDREAIYVFTGGRPDADGGKFVGTIRRWDGYGLGPIVPLYVKMLAHKMMRDGRS